MSPYEIRFTKTAKKEFREVPEHIQNKILEALTLLSTNPFTELLQIKKLRGADSLYRVRLGDYRVVYEVQKSLLIVLIIKIGHRREVYR